MTETQDGESQTIDPNKVSYGELATAAFQKAEIAVSEGAIVIEGMFDHAYAWMRGELVKAEAEVDSNALFLALQGEQQKRIKDANPVP